VRDERVGTKGRSKVERIMNKMGQRPSSRGWRTKRGTDRGLVGGKREDTLASQKYTPVFRARGAY
jgi:hypothetical protein